MMKKQLSDQNAIELKEESNCDWNDYQLVLFPHRTPNNSSESIVGKNERIRKPAQIVKNA